MKQATGISILYNSRKNKGTAFSREERHEYGITGLLPDGVETMETQLLRVHEQLDICESPINKYIYLTSLPDTNETLFFKTIMRDPATFLPLMYTPTIGLAGVEKPVSIRDFITSGMYVPEYK